MASDSDWVEDVRRWYFNGGHAQGKRPARLDGGGSRRPTSSTPAAELGYEAAQPSLQSEIWRETGAAELTELR